MNIHAKIPSTPEEFLVWNEGREGRREFVRGKVLEMMVNVSKHHLRLATALTHQLVNVLGTEKYDIGSADFGVKVGRSVRFPDVLVETFSENGKAHATESPLFIAEILSPSSMAEDFGPKALEYMGIPSLQHYLILSQDEPRAWLWSREIATWKGPGIVSGHDQELLLQNLSVRLDMASLYRGIA
jgi:Uma2 family endonuclease